MLSVLNVVDVDVEHTDGKVAEADVKVELEGGGLYSVKFKYDSTTGKAQRGGIPASFDEYIIPDLVEAVLYRRDELRSMN